MLEMRLHVASKDLECRPHHSGDTVRVPTGSSSFHKVATLQDRLDRTSKVGRVGGERFT
jgi:hypothetical protein